jgi:hypothetical protein
MVLPPQYSVSPCHYVRPQATCIGKQTGFVIEIMKDTYVPPTTSILSHEFLHADRRPFINKVVWIHHSRRCFYFFNRGGHCPHYTTKAAESGMFLQALRRHDIPVDVLEPDRSYMDPGEEVQVINEGTHIVRHSSLLGLRCVTLTFYLYVRACSM